MCNNSERKRLFIFYETGSSCRAEFLTKDRGFLPTEDAVMFGISEGRDARDALEKLTSESPWLKGYVFKNIIAREVGEPFYL
jgi:hypothetical protein